MTNAPQLLKADKLTSLFNLLIFDVMNKKDKNAHQSQSETVLSDSVIPNSISKTSDPLSDAQQKALTQIDIQMQSEQTEQGFIAAKQDADRALAENKIILNNRFVLMEALGAGGMGTVYKAQDLRKVEARDMTPYVAVKILNSDFKEHPDAFISLQREASRSHLLSHPNIVTVHDFDRDADTIFMTMELLDGQDLESFIAENANQGLEKELALEIFEDYCQALDYAHKKGIVHSDLKPGNIFVTKENGTKVLDFGIARFVLESKNLDHFDAGRIGAITPAYASLEMIGRQAPDPSDDVFAAAVIAYELFTGKHPFAKQSAATALAKGMKPEKIESLSKRQWKALSQGLELRRENRIGSIRELMLALVTVPKTPIYRSISLVLLSALAWFSYNQFFAPNELSLKVEETLTKANQCFVDKDFQCALESASAILELNPKHQQALVLSRNATIAKLVDEIERCLAEQNSTECSEAPLTQLSQLEPKPEQLALMSSKVDDRKRTLSVQKLLLKGNQCFAQASFSCALENARQALAIDESNYKAQQLAKESELAFEKQRVDNIKIDQQFKKSLEAANDCFGRQEFNCAAEKARQALELKPNSEPAADLLQSATFAEKQRQANLQRADKVLQDGYQCLKKLDYSCAIAKSESALEFLPGYAKAIKLKKDATEALNRVKKKIEIE